MENEPEVSEVLASETRKDILKRLCERNYRPSDLSRELEKDRSTITEHLKALTDAGLVERIEREGHKWIFYKLSNYGQALFPNQRRRVIYMALTLVAILGAMGSLLMHMESGLGQEITGRQATDAYVQKGAPGSEIISGSAVPMALGNYSGENASRVQEGQLADGSVYLYAALAFLVLGLIAAIQLAVKKGNELVIPKRRK
ncbi:MAG: winged helix-turn-helix domain-containing protein [Candidatus ainarchaeum sp.]|nr:winged helix-turn-helix domain-containing protein [Candidatus ainarchaeum sp.]